MTAGAPLGSGQAAGVATEPRQALGALGDPDGYAFVTRRRALVGNGVRDRLDPGVGSGRFARATAWARERIAPGEVAFAAFTFDPDVAGSALTITEDLLDRPAGAAGGAGPVVADGPKVRYAGSAVDELRWMEAVDTAAAAIRGGAYDKVVLARDLEVWSTAPLRTADLAARLAARFPSCMTFVHEGFVGATPELLVRRHGSAVRSVVLAGTAQPDAASGAALLRSDKDRVEHVIARDSVVAALAPWCEALEVQPEPRLLRLDNVQHLATTVSGRLAADHHVLELVAALHPTAAVCGTPTDVALAEIRRLEGLDRGRYTGPIGVVEHGGDGMFGVALRCAQVDGDRARLYAGCGIVGASLPEDELEETRLKLRAMQSVLG